MFASRSYDLIWLIAGLIVLVVTAIVQRGLIKRDDREDKARLRAQKVFLTEHTVLDGVSPDVAQAIASGLQIYLQNEDNKRFAVRVIRKAAEQSKK